MDKRDKVIAGLIVVIVLAIILLQFGMYMGRTASAEVVEFTPRTGALDLLKQQLSETRLDLEVEREKLSIILCESGAIHHNVWGDGGKSYGICQFQKRTFYWMAELANKPELRWKRRDDQVWLLDWALRHGYGKYWACYKGV